jgi:hypothetical protein
LLPPFFDEDLPPFLAAIQLTTFHAVRDLPVALTWQDVPDRSGKLISISMRWGEECRRPSTSTERLIQHLAVIVFLHVNMLSIKHIVKHSSLKR